MKSEKTSQELEIERYERNATKWAKRKARWNEFKKSLSKKENEKVS